MQIKLEDMVRKYAACAALIDENKHCGTCGRSSASQTECDGCYNELLGLPVNPTKWVGLQNI